jgi:hypothetical protein
VTAVQLRQRLRLRTFSRRDRGHLQSKSATRGSAQPTPNG